MKRLQLRRKANPVAGCHRCFGAIINESQVHEFSVISEIDSGSGVYLRGVQEDKVTDLLITVTSILNENGFEMPKERVTITVNGFSYSWDASMLSLPIAVSLYALLPDVLISSDDFFLCGDLSLSGELRDVKDASALSAYAGKRGRRIFLPKMQYLSCLSTYQADVIPADSFKEIITHLDQF